MQAKLLPGRYNLYGNSLETQVKYIERKNAVTRVPRQINLIPTTSEMMIFYDTFDFTACCLYVTATLIFAAVVPKTLNVNNSMLASIDNNPN